MLIQGYNLLDIEHFMLKGQGATKEIVSQIPVYKQFITTKGELNGENKKIIQKVRGKQITQKEGHGNCATFAVLEVKSNILAFA